MFQKSVAAELMVLIFVDMPAAEDVEIFQVVPHDQFLHVENRDSLVKSFGIAVDDFVDL